VKSSVCFDLTMVTQVGRSTFTDGRASSGGRELTSPARKCSIKPVSELWEGVVEPLASLAGHGSDYGELAVVASLRRRRRVAGRSLELLAGSGKLGAVRRE
jgi:hypothetical protein